MIEQVTWERVEGRGADPKVCSDAGMMELADIQASDTCE